MVQEQVNINEAWEPESGLIDDVDGWIANPHFGYKEEYAQAVLETSGEQGGLMFIVDLVSAKDELLGSQGYSVGTGWSPSEDGLSISHPSRSNVVKSSLYGQLQLKVVKELGVDMGYRGRPTDATPWDGLGFHWMQLPHKTVSGEPKTGLMPTGVLGDRGEAAPAAARTGVKRGAPPATGKAVSSAMKAALELVGACASAKEFQLKVVKVPVIVADDPLMAQCLDDSEDGFFAQHKVG